MGRGEGLEDWGDEYSINGRHGGKISVQTFSSPSLKILAEGMVTTEAGSLFQSFTALSFGRGSYLGVPSRGALQGRVEWEGEKTGLDPHPKDP